MRELTYTAPPVAKERARPVGGVGFDWLIVALSGWLLGGMYLDGWAQSEARRRLHGYHWRRHRPSRRRWLSFMLARLGQMFRR